MAMTVPAAAAAVMMAWAGPTPARRAVSPAVNAMFSHRCGRLGSGKLYARIGGVHAIERVMRDFADHHDDVTEVLNAFIREGAARREPL